MRVVQQFLNLKLLRSGQADNAGRVDSAPREMLHQTQFLFFPPPTFNLLEIHMNKKFFETHYEGVIRCHSKHGWRDAHFGDQPNRPMVTAGNEKLKDGMEVKAQGGAVK